jgi:hypothetical protein
LRGAISIAKVSSPSGDIAVTKLIAFCALTGLLAVAGCASQQQLVGQKEDLLAAAGFQIRVSDTPHRLAAMRSLPPNKFVTRIVNGQPVYLYADPLVCRCVYGTSAKASCNYSIMSGGVDCCIGSGDEAVDAGDSGV